MVLRREPWDQFIRSSLSFSTRRIGDPMGEGRKAFKKLPHIEYLETARITRYQRKYQSNNEIFNFVEPGKVLGCIQTSAVFHYQFPVSHNGSTKRKFISIINICRRRVSPIVEKKKRENSKNAEQLSRFKRVPPISSSVRRKKKNACYFDIRLIAAAESTTNTAAFCGRFAFVV